MIFEDFSYVFVVPIRNDGAEWFGVRFAGLGVIFSRFRARPAHLLTFGEKLAKDCEPVSFFGKACVWRFEMTFYEVILVNFSRYLLRNRHLEVLVGLFRGKRFSCASSVFNPGFCCICEGCAWCVWRWEMVACHAYMFLFACSSFSLVNLLRLTSYGILKVLGMEDMATFELSVQQNPHVIQDRVPLGEISNIPVGFGKQSGPQNVCDSSSKGKQTCEKSFATFVAKESSSRGLSDFEADLVNNLGDDAVDAYMRDAESSGLFSTVAVPANLTVLEGGVRVPFVEIDEELQREVDAGGAQKSADKIKWARKRFDIWREHVGIPTEKKIEELDLIEFAGQLEKFMLQVTKCDGQFYPTESLQDMFRKFGSIIRRHQEIIIANTGVHQYPFDITESPIFERARLACVATMRRSRRTPGVCKKRKKVDEIAYADEVALLSDIDHQITHPKGLQRRFLYYCVSRFAIRGQKELHLLVMSDFVIGIENSVEYLEYDERTSKNYDADMTHYQEEQFRMGCRCYESDVVVTYRQLLRHLPDLKPSASGAIPSKFCFMQAIVHHKGNIWYNSVHRVSARKLAEWMKYMLKTVGVDGKFSGKSGRTTAISRMARAGVPQSVGMRITGQRTPEAYSRYDKTKEVQAKCAMSVVSNPFDEKGQRRMYENVYAEELDRLDEQDRAGSVLKDQVVLPPAVEEGNSDVVKKVDSSSKGTITSAVAGLLDSLHVNSAGELVSAVPSVAEVVSVVPSAMESADIQLNNDLDVLSETNPIVRKALGMEVNIGSITGGSFQNCNILMPCVSRDELHEIMVNMMRNSKNL